MAYTDEGVRAKLSSLNETQESIVTVAQWIMFHRRYADRSASVWLQKLKDSPPGKRLNLIYLANEVVQQSKARRKDDFLIAFSPIIAEATSTAYKGAMGDLQSKLKRVVEVWKQRQIFEPSIQEAVEARIAEIDKNRSTNKKPLLGGSIFSGSQSGPAAPPELQPLVPMQNAISKAAIGVANAGKVTTEYEKLMGPDAELPSPPVYAARISGLLKTLANAEGAVSESIKARRDIIGGLEKLLQTNKSALSTEESLLEDLNSKKSAAESKKREVEDEILRKLPSESPQGDGTGNNVNLNGNEDEDLDRPQMEELTPPPVESFTPTQSPRVTAMDSSNANGSDTPALHENIQMTSLPTGRAYSGSPVGEGMNKRRKIEPEHHDFVPGDAMADLDEDVAELLRQESGQN